jgi:hypothetical protein
MHAPDGSKRLLDDTVHVRRGPRRAREAIVKHVEVRLSPSQRRCGRAARAHLVVSVPRWSGELPVEKSLARRSGKTTDPLFPEVSANGPALLLRAPARWRTV